MPTVPPGGDAFKTVNVVGDFATTLEDLAMKLLIEKDRFPSSHCSRNSKRTILCDDEK
jgi:uncharacterized protein (DUF488 family)